MYGVTVLMRFHWALDRNFTIPTKIMSKDKKMENGFWLDMAVKGLRHGDEA